MCKGAEYIRVGSYTKRLRDHPEKERALWSKSSQVAFERELAVRNLPTEEVISLLDYPAYFELTRQPLPTNRSSILKQLEREKLIARFGDQKWNITNLGALLFARRLSVFDSLGRKAVRVVIYKGRDRTDTITSSAVLRDMRQVSLASSLTSMIVYHLTNKLVKLYGGTPGCIRNWPSENW